MIRSLLDLFLLLLGGKLVYSELRVESIVGFKVSCVLKMIHERAESLSIVSIPELHKPVQTLHRNQMPE